MIIVHRTGGSLKYKNQDLCILIRLYYPQVVLQLLSSQVQLFFFKRSQIIPQVK